MERANKSPAANNGNRNSNNPSRSQRPRREDFADDNRPHPRANATTIDRQPPFDRNAEKGLIGSLVLQLEALDDVATIVKADDFFDTAHEILYRHMLAMHEEGKKFDVTLLSHRLKRSQTHRGQIATAADAASSDWETIGGAAFLNEIVSCVPNAAHAVYYAEIVRDKALLRRIIWRATEIVQEGYGGVMEPQDLLAYADSSFAQVSDRALEGSEAQKLSEAVIASLESLDQKINGTVSGLSTGIAGFDSVNRLRGGELTIIGGRPSMGKSALAQNIAYHVTKHSHDEATLFISLEMAKMELANRMLSSESRVPLYRLNNGMISQNDRLCVVNASEYLGQLPLYIDDNPMQTVHQIGAQARRLKRKSGLKLIVIDYLQLIEPDNPRDPRQEQVAKIARRLKLLARSLDVPVIAMSQLNRRSEESSEPRPRLSDLRESGAIEQDADNVMFVHRPAYYKGESPTDGTGEQALIIMAKGRNAPVGDIEMLWFGRHMEWRNPANDQQEEYTGPASVPAGSSASSGASNF